VRSNVCLDKYGSAFIEAVLWQGYNQTMTP